MSVVHLLVRTTSVSFIYLLDWDRDKKDDMEIENGLNDIIGGLTRRTQLGAGVR